MANGLSDEIVEKLKRYCEQHNLEITDDNFAEILRQAVTPEEYAACVLSDDTQSQLDELCAKGDSYAEAGDYETALQLYWQAWDLLPDLLVVDGGKGQLNVALEVLDEFGLRDQVPAVGLAKQEEEIFVAGRSEPLELPRTSEGLFLMQRIRDEAHRFAITYHRHLRRKQTVISQLDGVPGIGPKVARDVLDELRGRRRARVD